MDSNTVFVVVEELPGLSHHRRDVQPAGGGIAGCEMESRSLPWMLRSVLRRNPNNALLGPKLTAAHSAFSVSPNPIDDISHVIHVVRTPAALPAR